VHLLLARLQAVAGKPDQADSEIEKAIQLDPKSEEPYIVRASLQIGRNDLTGAEAS
jgi:Tfp pilus assembly protein PilF